jgi:hypothetical protein
VLVPATSSPLGLGSRVLTLLELGGLWDIPILVMDLLVGPASEDIFRAIFDTPPTKSLLIGADSLLTTLFRGGFTGRKSLKRREFGDFGDFFAVEQKTSPLGNFGNFGFFGKFEFFRNFGFFGFGRSTNLFGRTFY